MSLEDHSLTPVVLIDTPQIDKPILALKDLNLEDALLAQYNNATKLLTDVLQDSEVPANQRAQCINSVTAILASITKSQESLYNAERVKKLELALVTTLKTLSKEAQEVFFNAYETELKRE